MSWRDRCLHWLLPRTCAGCREDLPSKSREILCRSCAAALRPLRRSSGRAPPGVRLARAAFAYRSPVPALIHAFKYRSRLSVGEFLGAEMAAAWPGCGLGSPDALVPVPLHSLRQGFRGFNQARVLAERIGASTRLPVLDALARIRRTAPRARTARGRRSPLDGAFRAVCGLRGARLVLIDDVWTTGGTLSACARELRRAGAEEVRAFVLARGG